MQVTADILRFMLKRDYEGQTCSIARTLEVVGDRWTLLVIRDVGVGHHRFDQLLKRLGIASNVLTVAEYGWSRRTIQSPVRTMTGAALAGIRDGVAPGARATVSAPRAVVSAARAVVSAARSEVGALFNAMSAVAT